MPDHILTWSNPGEILFDPMCGSGTTCKMALKNSRLYLGCDISEEYIKISQKRLAGTKIETEYSLIPEQKRGISTRFISAVEENQSLVATG